MAQAIGYRRNEWEALCRDCEARQLDIDNNAAQRALRRVGIGRENWLFAGHDVAAQRTATLYTLVASAGRHGLDPQRYLTGVLARMPSMSVSQLEKLLPERWKAAEGIGDHSHIR